MACAYTLMELVVCRISWPHGYLCHPLSPKAIAASCWSGNPCFGEFFNLTFLHWLTSRPRRTIFSHLVTERMRSILRITIKKEMGFPCGEPQSALAFTLEKMKNTGRFIFWRRYRRGLRFHFAQRYADSNPFWLWCYGRSWKTLSMG